MRKYLKDLKPNVFEDLIAMVSLYRPGPLAYIPNFIERKYGREEIKYMTDDLTAIMIEAGYTQDIIDEVRDTIIKPTIDGLRAEGTPYVGVLYAGVMLTKSGVSVCSSITRP